MDASVDAGCGGAGAGGKVAGTSEFTGTAESIRRLGKTTVYEASNLTVTTGPSEQSCERPPSQ